MPGPLDRLRAFLAELRRRKVYRVAVAYLAVAFVGLQAVSLLVPATTLPEWAEPFLVALAVLGFPIALVLAWAFELTPEGVRRTEAPGFDAAAPGRERAAGGGRDADGRHGDGPHGDARYGARHLLAVFVGGLLVAVAGYGGYALLAGGGEERAAVDGETADDVVVVFPFRVSGGDDELGQGMVDLLSVKLAGSPRHRPVDPRSALSAWRSAAGGGGSRGDLLRAARLVGAGKVVDGSVVRSGPELVLTASVVEVPGGASAEPITVRGPPERLPDLVDELAARLLALEVGQVGRLASLTSPSLDAVRSWVRGRVAYRDARYREASGHFEEALRTDSAFALAAVDLLAVSEWMSGSGVQRRLAERLAWAARSDLTPRDRAMLDVMVGPRYPDPSPMVADLEADRRAVDLAPDSPEAWFYFGDDVYHFGGLVGVEGSVEEGRDAFARALALDSTFAAPLGHLLEVHALRADSGRVRRLLPLYLSRHPDSELADFHRWRGATLLGDTATLTELRGRWGTVPTQALWRIVGYGRIDGRGLDDADAVAGVLRNRPGPPAERTITRTILQGYYLDRGRPAEALAVQRELGGLLPAGELPAPAYPVREELVRGAIFWDGDREAAAAAVRELEEGGWQLPSAPAERSRRMRELCLAAQWWAHEGGRPADVRRAVRTLGSSRYPEGWGPEAARDRRCAALLRVMTADPDRTGETARRVQALDSLSVASPSMEFSVRANVASARALSAAGLEERALAIVSRDGPVWHREYLATRLRWEARLAAATGQEEQAARARRHYRALRGEEPGPDPAR